MRSGFMFGITLGAITTAVVLKTPIVKKVMKSFNNK